MMNSASRTLSMSFFAELHPGNELVFPAVRVPLRRQWPARSSVGVVAGAGYAACVRRQGRQRGVSKSVLDAEVMDALALCEGLAEAAIAKRRYVPLPVAELYERAAEGLLLCHLERLTESPVRVLDSAGHRCAPGMVARRSPRRLSARNPTGPPGRYDGPGSAAFAVIASHVSLRFHVIVEASIPVKKLLLLDGADLAQRRSASESATSFRSRINSNAV